MTTRPALTLITAVQDITDRLDDAANPTLAGLPELLLRALKVQEEAGELAQAVIGALGQNARKGVTHTLDDVATEAADVALAALVFAATVYPGDLAALLNHRAAHVRDRLTATLHPVTEHRRAA
jgi:NTP pyrophosphatase (non-canonical NTP hydrolase)